MIRRLLHKIRNFAVGAITASLILGLTTTGRPARASGIPVVDIAHIIQSILNTAEQIYQWYSYVRQFREYYSLAHGAFQSLKDWRSLGWVDILNTFEMPWFDGLDGIEDLRNLSAATGMGLEALGGIFREVEILDRMRKDPLYAANEGYRARVEIWYKVQQKILMRRIALTRSSKKNQEELKALQLQLISSQGELESLSGQDPAPLGAINAVHGKIGVIQSKMALVQSALDHQRKIAKDWEEQLIEQARSDQEMKEFDFTPFRDSAKKFWESW